jgi:protein-S-isoprenylcysteine O-methyltransferase Ste14
MSDLKTMPAALADLLRPRRMARVRRTVARSRAEGALFDAALGTAVALVAVVALTVIVNTVDVPLLERWGIDDAWLVAGTLLVALFGAGALWWRWFKWNLLAVDLAQAAPGAREPSDGVNRP